MIQDSQNSLENEHHSYRTHILVSKITVGAGTVVKWVRLLPVTMLASHMWMPISVWLFHFSSSSLQMCLGTQQKVAPVLGPLPWIWAIQVEFLAPVWPSSDHCGHWGVNQKNGFCLCSIYLWNEYFFKQNYCKATIAIWVLTWGLTIK